MRDGDDFTRERSSIGGRPRALRGTEPAERAHMRVHLDEARSSPASEARRLHDLLAELRLRAAEAAWHVSTDGERRGSPSATRHT